MFPRIAPKPKVLAAFVSLQAGCLQGSRHTIGDFVVKVGAILHNEEFKGIIVEVEYFPVKYIPTAKPILAEFSKILKQHTTGLHTGR